MDDQVALGSTRNVVFRIKNPASNWVPINPDAAPTFKVYDPDVDNQAMANGTGTASQRDTGSITGATNASPIVITSTSHGLQTGDRLTVVNVGGNTAANGTFTITKVDANSFSLDDSTGNGAYTSGGTWNVTGLFYVAVPATTGNGYSSGEVYPIVVDFEISSTAYSIELKLLVY